MHTFQLVKELILKVKFSLCNLNVMTFVSRCYNVNSVMTIWQHCLIKIASLFSLQMWWKLDVVRVCISLQQQHHKDYHTEA